MNLRVAARLPGPPAADGPAAPETDATVSAVLQSYDHEVEESLRQATGAQGGLERVRALHNGVRPAVVIHDAVVFGTLCPLIDRLPGGHDLAAQLRRGCEERAELLARFDAVSRNVAAHNVYPVSGDEVEAVLAGLAASFAAHARAETSRLGEIVEAAASRGDRAGLLQALGAQARRAPTRRSLAGLRWRSRGFLALYRFLDHLADWSDTHWNWNAVSPTTASPRAELVRALQDLAGVAGLTVREVIEGWDRAVGALIGELGAARAGAARAAAAARVVAGIAIHDSVTGGVICPLLERVGGGEVAVQRIRWGLHERAALQAQWQGLVEGIPPDDLYRRAGEKADALLAELIENFDQHTEAQAAELATLLAPLPAASYRTRNAPLEDMMWPWHGEGPALLALHMAVWAESAATRAHPAVQRHPTSRVLRSFYYAVDQFHDRWAETWLESWFFPTLPQRPLSRPAAHGHDAP